MNLGRIRSSLSTFAADLRSGRLLAGVGLLVLLAIAIPLVFSHPGTPASLAALAPVPPVTTPVPTPASVSTTQHPTPHTNYLAARAHDPFATASKPAAASSSSQAGGGSAVASSRGTGSAGSSTSSGSTGLATAASSNLVATTGSTDSANTTSQVSSPVTTPAAGVPANVPTATGTTTVVRTVIAPAPYADYEAKVFMRRDGATTKPRLFSRLSRYQLLPADSRPVLSFLGIRPDKRTAVFLLAGGVDVAGRGRCAPSTDKCTFLTLQPGQSVKLETPMWAGSQTFTLRFAGVAMITSSASVVNVDPSGRTFVRTTGTNYAPLRGISYGKFRGLLSIKLGATAPVAP